MIPARPDTDCATSERSVFERFAAGLPASWTVLHGRKLVLPATPKMPTQTCEIDFLVLDPARGLLALKVKGGGVQRESDDLWYSIEVGGTVYKIHKQRKQVARAAAASSERWSGSAARTSAASKRTSLHSDVKRKPATS